MSARDKYALAAGIVLGVISGALTVAAMFAAGIVFIGCSILSPLIVSLVAEKKIRTLSQVPNLVMTLTSVMIFFGLGGYSSMPWHYGPAEIMLGILTVLLMAAVPAFTISELVKLIRRKRKLST